jgi:hypothetical protein
MIVIAWTGTPHEAPDLRHIQGEVMRACLSRPDLTLYAPGFPVAASDPLWRLGERLVTDVAPPRVDIHLFPLAGPVRDEQPLIDRASVAMASQQAIIATDLDPLRRILWPGRNGVLIPGGRMHAWNREILRLAVQAEDRARLGRNALNTARAIEKANAL